MFKMVDGVEVLCSAGEEAAILARWAVNTPPTALEMVAADHAAVVSMLNSLDRQAKMTRAVVLVILDEFNAHRVQMNAIKTAVETAATLAAAKTALLLITPYPARTQQQLLTAMAAKINAGDVDV